jgi:predicted 3-demethylubiquinone-9 3-methyltransferase (glyoxalase superfamily)
MAGKELVVEYELDGQHFLAINAGPQFKFSEAISFTISCEGQDDIDYCWERLSNVPQAEQCGWCKDRFGLSWQVVPRNMGELMKRPNAYAHMMQMKKLVIADF